MFKSKNEREISSCSMCVSIGYAPFLRFEKIAKFFKAPSALIGLSKEDLEKTLASNKAVSKTYQDWTENTLEKLCTVCRLNFFWLRTESRFLTQSQLTADGRVAQLGEMFSPKHDERLCDLYISNDSLEYDFFLEKANGSVRFVIRFIDTVIMNDIGTVPPNIPIQNNNQSINNRYFLELAFVHKGKGFSSDEEAFIIGRIPIFLTNEDYMDGYEAYGFRDRLGKYKQEDVDGFVDEFGEYQYHSIIPYLHFHNDELGINFSTRVS